MYKLFFTATILFAVCMDSAMAQKAIDGLIAAENNFAAYAAQHNTKDAFLHFLDSAEGVVFEEGKITSAYDKWNKAAANGNILTWQPAFAGIAQSGELGFTAGQWQFGASATGTAQAGGNFATIWHLNAKGEWKFLANIGTQAGLQHYAVDSVKKWVGGNNDNDDGRDALTIDRMFIQQYYGLKNDAFKAAVIDDTWFNVPGQKPLTGVQNITAFLPQIPTGLYFNPVGGGVSASGELAYVYGTVRHDAKMANYLRVWHKAKGKYTILLQVLQW